MNCALDWPEPTVTLAGTLTLPLPLVKLTVIALDAAPVRLTVQTEVPAALTVPGAQLNPLSCTDTTRLIAVERLLPFSDAVTFAV